jgi:hypothetical protein
VGRVALRISATARSFLCGNLQGGGGTRKKQSHRGREPLLPFLFFPLRLQNLRLLLRAAPPLKHFRRRIARQGDGAVPAIRVGVGVRFVPRVRNRRDWAEPRRRPVLRG